MDWLLCVFMLVCGVWGSILSMKDLSPQKACPGSLALRVTHPAFFFWLLMLFRLSLGLLLLTGGALGVIRTLVR
jgi:hypothetical protein